MSFLLIYKLCSWCF